MIEIERRSLIAIRVLSVCAVAVLFGFGLSTPGFGQDDDDAKKDETPGINSSLLSSFRLRGIGPAFMSGRITDIAVDPVHSSTRYITAAAGGVWKTSNAGVTWKPIFDNYGSYSVGCVTIDPKNRFTVWIGSGENNSQRSVGYGDGVYKSIDGGKSFKNIGLKASEHIAKIVVHPEDSNTVFVAAQGPLWASGGDRGLYKTTNGGETWNKILDISENTGVTDLVLDPRDPNTMYAAAYQRRRHVWTLIDGGPESSIYKTTDGGKNWRKVNRGLPGGDKGRIGLAISPQKPDVLYAIVEATGSSGGFFKSTDRAESWSKQSSYVSSSPQYYQEIVACPHKFDRVYSLDTYMQVSEDGGKNFNGLGESFKHVDNHALYIDPADEEHLVIGCDGGLYETYDRGKNYRFSANLPLSQYYKIAVGTDKPFYYVYGGTQDNATQGGPSRTNNIHGIRNSDWFTTVFGDGFDPVVDPDDPDTIYSQWQYGGLVRFNRKSGTRIDIKPQAEKGGPALRFNWDSGLAMSPHDSKTIYYGSQFLHRSRDKGQTWETISKDLSRNVDRNKLKVMGRVWGIDTVAKNASTSFYGTIVCVAESPVKEDVLYVGTDDGMVQVSEDGGDNWTAVGEFTGADEVPEFGYIHDIEPCLHDANTVFVVVNNFKRGDFKPYIVKSEDGGKSWKLISDTLPERGSTYCLKQDAKNKDLLFCGTEFGLFVTLDGGKKWLPMKSGLPVVAVRDIEIQREEVDLVVGTFGRGIYILDDYTPIREISEKLIEEKAKILPIKTGKMFVQAAPMSGRDKAFQGASFYTAPNPAFGVAITWWLKEGYKTKKSERKKKEGKAKSSGGNVAYPSWDDLKAEAREESPVVSLRIRNSDGDVVRTLSGSNSKGVHRTTWDFRQQLPVSGGGRFGPYALPGKYTVEVVARVDGEETQLAEPTEFEVEPLGWEGVAEEERVEILAFQKQTAKLQHAISSAYSILQDTTEELATMKSAVDSTPGVDATIRKTIREHELKLIDMTEKFTGDRLRPQYNEPGVVGILSRISNVVRGHWSTDMAPTTTHKSSYEVAEAEFTEVLPKLKSVVEEAIPALRKQLDEAGVRWTKGRKIPDWK